ncbi:hypothetical protein FE374_07935 [Georgenia yuyongxinii]|uniref:Uncharacterized protein n=1 Tax=Georgenia yuyongxinii TaxID=2589797 RepID=A0A5B8C1T6_9MICO|nr:hypothetical protein FE374_07935 [Georgenia yuyongxinii]
MVYVEGQAGPDARHHGLVDLRVSEMVNDPHAHVNDSRTRPWDAGLYTVAAADALRMKVRGGGRVINDRSWWLPGEPRRPWRGLRRPGRHRRDRCRSPASSATLSPRA